MSPSPRWCDAAEVPVGQAIAAAQHDAWCAPDPAIRARIFAERFRQLVGYQRAEALLVPALAIYHAQPDPPAGWEDPPRSAHFRICPRCQQLKRAKFTIPQHGRLKLQVLRDKDWLEAQFAQRRTCKAIARQLGCAPANVVYFAEQHGLQPPKTANAEARRAKIAGLHRDGQCPGEICAEVARAAEDYLPFLDETDAMIRSGRSAAWLRARFDDWAREGHAERRQGRRFYRAVIVPRRADLEAAREAGRRGETVRRRKAS